MIKVIKGGYEETLKGVTKTYQWTKSGYVEIPKHRNVNEEKN